MQVETKEGREFKGIWIPAELYLNLALSWEAKIIWAEIDSFCSKSRECFFSNEHLAERLGISERSVRRHIAELKEGGLIVVRMEGSRRFMHTEARTDLSGLGGQKRPGKAVRNGQHKSIKDTIPKEGITEPDGSAPKTVSEAPLQQLSIENTDTIQTELLPPMTDADHERLAYPLCVDVWYNMDKKRKFTAIDGRKMKSIISRIVHYMKNDGKGHMITAENIALFFVWYVKHERLPGFMCNAQLSVFDSQFDKTVFELRYGRKQDNSHQQNSANRHFGKYAHE